MQQLITTPNKVKCINLDWLSVYCLEPKGVVLNAAYFKALGWTVEEREYGTPQCCISFDSYIKPQHMC